MGVVHACCLKKTHSSRVPTPKPDQHRRPMMARSPAGRPIDRSISPTARSQASLAREQHGKSTVSDHARAVVVVVLVPGGWCSSTDARVLARRHPRGATSPDPGALPAETIDRTPPRWTEEGPTRMHVSRSDSVWHSTDPHHTHPAPAALTPAGRTPPGAPLGTRRLAGRPAACALA